MIIHFQVTKIIENIQNPHRPRIPIGEPYPNRSNHQIPGISLVTESHKVRLLSFFNVPILHQYHFRKNTYVNIQKHVRLFGKTCTCFNANITMFFTTLIFNPLKTRPDFLLIVKFFLFRDTRKRRGINTHTFTHWLKAKKEERELAFLRTYLCR